MNSKVRHYKRRVDTVSIYIYILYIYVLAQNGGVYPKQTTEEENGGKEEITIYVIYYFFSIYIKQRVYK